ncbi:hypothetical protein EMIT043CA1_120181 [Pseudomonas brassicacearum]
MSSTFLAEVVLGHEIDASSATKIYLTYSRRVLTFITDICFTDSHRHPAPHNKPKNKSAAP